MKKLFKLLPPTMPNFIYMEMPPATRQDGFDADRGKLSITDLSEEEATEYGELMKQAFIEHWKTKTKNAGK